MGFSAPSGPPATARQLRELLDLLHAAGHTDFRDARGPMGFTQRQANGKFTRDEADEFIARLQADDDATTTTPVATPAPAATPARAARAASRAGSDRLADIPDDALAAELQRRGWAVIQP